jgi:acetyl-CoA carboxylase alpha subunit
MSPKNTDVDVELPEKRDVNFFVRIKKTNEDWAKAQAAKAARKGERPNVSQWVDALFDKLRGG